LRRAASRAVEATNSLAVQSPWTPPHRRSILDSGRNRKLTDREMFDFLGNRKPIHRKILIFPRTETRISID
jgi:hypothetical protein